MREREGEGEREREREKEKNNHFINIFCSKAIFHVRLMQISRMDF